MFSSNLTELQNYFNYVICRREPVVSAQRLEASTTMRTAIINTILNFWRFSREMNGPGLEGALQNRRARTTGGRHPAPGPRDVPWVPWGSPQVSPNCVSLVPTLPIYGAHKLYDVALEVTQTGPRKKNTHRCR